MNPLLARIVAFLESIGLPVRLAPIVERTFLPGLTVQGGILVVDEQQLQYPGDVLHEAGHLAVLPPSRRARADGEMGPGDGLEMAAIAWSYAAAVHLEIAPSVLFHEGGYSGGALVLIEKFAAGQYVGLPVLEWAGLAAGEQRAKVLGIPAYPSMLHWLREEGHLDPVE